LVSLRHRESHRPETPTEDGYEVPALFLKDIVLLPFMEVSLSLKENVGREAVLESLSSRHLVAMVPADGYRVGDIGTLTLLDEEEGSKEQVSLKGLWRIRIREVRGEVGRPKVKFTRIEDFKEAPGAAAMVRKVHGQVDEFLKLMPSLPKEVVSPVLETNSPGKLADLCAASPMFNDRERLEFLEMLDPQERLERVSDRLERALQALREAARPTQIQDCEICMDFADRALEAGDSTRNLIVADFLEHVVEKHPAEIMNLIAEKYGPSFMQKRSLR
jgi:ATP-dependent Lon protease